MFKLGHGNPRGRMRFSVASLAVALMKVFHFRHLTVKFFEFKQRQSKQLNDHLAQNVEGGYRWKTAFHVEGNLFYDTRASK